MLVSEFDYDLPSELIAQEPPMDRGDSRLLQMNRSDGSLTHSTVAALPTLLSAGDLVVVNNTRVFPARLIGRRVPSGGAVECLLVGRVDAPGGTPGQEHWEALVHPGQKLKPGAEVVFEGAATLHGEILERRFHGRRVVRFWTDDRSSVQDVVDRIGHIPLPPYIKRVDRAADRERYQTVFARTRGSIAAPTAGLHFSPGLLDALRDRDIAVAEITLHVGYGTFQPVRVERVEDHHVEPEHYDVSGEAAAAINQARFEGRRVVAVGTTTTRALESVARAHGNRMVAGGGVTDLFIHPGFDFRVVAGLLTNFHLPRSSLLMLVAAFGGRDRVLSAYREAVARGYRFYSYGDAMLVL